LSHSRSASFDHIVGPWSTDGGIVRPSSLAVLRLITSSYLVGACPLMGTLKTKGPSARPGPSIADCCRTEQRRIHTRHARHPPENSAPVRPQKHTPHPISLKRHFRGYVIWQTQLDTAPGKRLATAGPTVAWNLLQ